ncbi:MAG: hypothetical protein EHM70_04085 [Chloroflexota bacterium]|nr:MAG: hypothetical protein EHM70_04085 [Chloroflexota bacterium]
MDGAKLTPQQTRAAEAAFVSQCSLASLQPHLPLGWPVPPEIPPSPKKSYRSGYGYPFQAEVADRAQVLGWKDLSDFDLLLRLVDFSHLRPVLAHLLGWQSGRGWQPFDPVSLFLLVAWQITNRWKRSQTLRNLADPRYADYARFFGFQNGVYPTEGGLRYFLTGLGCHSDADGESVAVKQGEVVVQVLVQKLNLLLTGAVDVLRAAQVLSGPAWEEALLCPDGQLHDAASQPHCISVTENCYQPCTPDQPRPCPAKPKERRGCECDHLACAQVCRHATSRDPQARYVWYTGSNQSADHPNRSTQAEDRQSEHGEGHYGYRSLPLRLADPLRRFSVTVLNDVRPAHEHEDLPSAALLLQLKKYYPDLRVDAVAGDAGLGFDSFLHTVYSLRARRVVDLRQHATDRDEPLWPTRGYDDRGRPVCNYGYRLVSYGFDRQRQRHTWCCDQACLKGKQPEVRLAQVVYPPPECPYQLQRHGHGRVVAVGERFADASIRLVRDIPVGSSTWKALYRRARNAVEGRNARLEDWGLKRMPVYGLPRVKALIFLADTLDTLTTLARLVREATLAGCAA